MTGVESSLLVPRLGAFYLPDGDFGLDFLLPHRPRHRDAVVTVTDIVDLTHLNQINRWKRYPELPRYRDIQPSRPIERVPWSKSIIKVLRSFLTATNTANRDRVEAQSVSLLYLALPYDVGEGS